MVLPSGTPFSVVVLFSFLCRRFQSVVGGLRRLTTGRMAENLECDSDWGDGCVIFRAGGGSSDSGGGLHVPLALVLRSVSVASVQQ